eukprot:14023677-Ditylum_brightwellii.AAC.1
MRSCGANMGCADRMLNLISAAAAGDVDEVKMILSGAILYHHNDANTPKDSFILSTSFCMEGDDLNALITWSMIFPLAFTTSTMPVHWICSFVKSNVTTISSMPRECICAKKCLESKTCEKGTELLSAGKMSADDS